MTPPRSLETFFVSLLLACLACGGALGCVGAIEDGASADPAAEPGPEIVLPGDPPPDGGPRSVITLVDSAVDSAKATDTAPSAPDTSAIDTAPAVDALVATGPASSRLT
ncbi:MAG: hypothetical protein ABI175_25520, partial [Polyangiales bacterium]